MWKKPLLPEPGFTERFKVCTCCGNEYDLGSWLALHFVGVQFVPAGDEPGEHEYWMEYRDCSCGTTLTVELAP